MHITICKVDDQCKFDAPKDSALGQPRGIRWEGDSGWGDTCIPVADSH